MRTIHWYDFEMSLQWPNDEDGRTVRVEVTLSSGSDGTEIEGLKVKLLDSNVEVVPSDQQLKDIYLHINDEIIPHADEPGDDWRNEY